MPKAQIGPWEFDMPEGWVQTENESSDCYFQSPDGSKGLYVKAIELSEPKPKPQDVADYIQDVHSRSYLSLDDSSWVVADRWLREDRDLMRGGVDLYDARAKYRVLSLVLCNTREAIQLTIHDYWCEQYDSTRGAFSQVEGSIGQIAGAV